MNDVIQKLLKLQALELEKPSSRKPEPELSELRGQIPPSILAHYERLTARGKKGVAIVRNQVCTGCHMKLPIGTLNTLMHDEDIQLCDSCGRYLYLPDTAETQFLEHVAASKPAVKPRKRQTLAHVV